MKKKVKNPTIRALEGAGEKGGRLFPYFHGMRQKRTHTVKIESTQLIHELR